MKQFDTYETLSDYCYPFKKNLAKGISDELRIVLLESIGRFYRQRLDEINKVLNYPKPLLVNMTNDSHYWGRWCWGDIIELDVSLICAHPLALTEVIIHELSHYESHKHDKAFYSCLTKNIERMGLSNQLYGYGAFSEGRNPKSVQVYFKDIEEHQKEIRKLFRPPLRKKSVYPPIPHGTLPDFFSYQDFVGFCTPPHKTLPRITGLLDRIKIISYAERFYKEIIQEYAFILGIRVDEVHISRQYWVLKDGILELPLWFIGLEEKILRQLLVRILTYYQQRSQKNNRMHYQENLRRLNLVETYSTSFLIYYWVKNWNNCFNETGRKRMIFLFSEVIDIPKSKQLSLF